MANSVNYLTKRIDFQTILDKFQSIKGYPLMLYLDTPFCPTVCKFCAYQTSKYTKSKCNTYIAELKDMLISAKSVLSKPIESVYFGGGTPNLISTDTWEEIIQLVPNFDDIPAKAMELHPAFVSDKWLDFLTRHKFSYVSFGIQSFNKEALAEQDRTPYNVTKLKDFITELSKHGVVVNCDLLTYFKTGNLVDINDLMYDLEEVWKTGCHCINIYPTYQSFNYALTKDAEYHSIEPASLRKIQKLRTTVLLFLKKHPELELINYDIEKLVKKSSIEKTLVFDIQLQKKGVNIPLVYNCSGFPNHPANQAVLGLGGFEQKQVYGHIGKEFYYITHMSETREYYEYL